jgi:hypothetical protein
MPAIMQMKAVKIVSLANPGKSGQAKSPRWAVKAIWRLLDLVRITLSVPAI